MFGLVSFTENLQVFTDISSVALVEAQETFEANHLMVETLLGDFFEPLEGAVKTLPRCFFYVKLRRVLRGLVGCWSWWLDFFDVFFLRDGDGF